MERYGNYAGNSGIRAFELGDSWIRLLFQDYCVYTYDASAPGPEAVAEMKRLALAGRGLSTYVSQHVREKYSSKQMLA